MDKRELLAMISAGRFGQEIVSTVTESVKAGSGRYSRPGKGMGRDTG
jgi:hypothetical protein